ncbi:dyslexia-associated protein KIAA0319-like protein isoform X2 [Hydractinia symbiolongicarpus]|uniref:dyslexia-associated protein KIAA0319-like protein isoform X2 n=1 Tax=Hydractinia symbiolongicarpus TaxID=13093 RepID=UPI00254F7AE1|nr:dyslexia-associated protein KIAA0319-like protein isoform X2 [Hydractinia symbiolongicarpus]
MASARCGQKNWEGRFYFQNFDLAFMQKKTNDNNQNISNERCYCNKQALYGSNYNKYTKVMHILLLSLVIFSSQTLCSAYRHNSDWNIDNSESDSRYSSDTTDYEVCLHGEYLKGYTLEGGTKAGDYHNIGEVDGFEECAELCCQKYDCNLAIMLTYPKSERNTCFKVDCYDPESSLCKLKSARHSKYRPHLFRRGVQQHKHKKVATSEENAHSIINNETILNKDLPSLKRDKRIKSMCHEYTGTVCRENIDHTKLYYYTANNDTSLDERLRGPIHQISSRLSGSCRDIALQAICYRFYPQCKDHTHPKPIPVCESECDRFMYGKCSKDFADANMLQYLQHVITNCGIDQKRDIEDGDAKSCIHLQENLTPLPTNHVDETETPMPDSNSDLKSTGTDPKSGDTDSSSQSNSTDKFTTPNFSTDRATSMTDKNGITDYTPTSMSFNRTQTPTASLFNTSSTIGNLTVTAQNASVDKPSISDIKDSADQKESALDALVATPTASPSPAALPSPTRKDTDKEIRVSAGDDTEIELPENEVSLFASTWPKEKYDGEYAYRWSQISAPKHSHGYIEGKTLRNVKLTKLDIPGVYTFKLHVSSISGKYGVGYVNITVKDPTHLNHPPRAEIYPKEQTISLPTNTVVLDGSKSSDDDAIVSYKWEELKGPIKENTVFGSNTASKILQLKNLVAGEYNFRLTVTDSNGETDSVETTVTVKEEQDYPPKANAGNDIVLHLPNNSVILNGNKSTDDKNELTYAWSKSSDSPICDMQGTDKVQLHVSSLVEGTYVFNLKVTDSNGQSDIVHVKVIVLPEVNTKPVAVAGDDKELVYPDVSTTLDGSRSTDNSKIISYKWEKIEGPDSIKMIDSNKVKVHISDLRVGTYVIKLTVTDDKQLTGSDTVRINVKQDHNEPPTAVVNPQQVIYLPSRSAVLDGSKSKDDEIIVGYHWTRAGSSPAAGDIINGSNHHSILRLANLVKGKYIFDLTVTDNKGLTGKASVTVIVKEDPNKIHLVEMYLDIAIGSFTEESKKQLIRKISVVLEVGKEFVVVEEIASVHYKKGVKLVFYVKDPNMNRMYDGKYIADLLKQKVGFGGKLFDITMMRVSPYICRNNCSNHGYCDDATKECICDTFWMSNFFKAKFGVKESNCDWSILYLSVAIFAIFLLLLGLIWSICFFLARKKRSKRRARYRALRSTDPDGADDEILLIPKAMKEKFSANSLTFTESDEDSEEETTVFDKNRLVNGHARLNGSANGKLKYRDHAM